jgi:hypothetical protein
MPDSLITLPVRKTFTLYEETENPHQPYVAVGVDRAQKPSVYLGLKLDDALREVVLEPAHNDISFLRQRWNAVQRLRLFTIEPRENRYQLRLMLCDQTRPVAHADYNYGDPDKGHEQILSETARYLKRHTGGEINEGYPLFKPFLHYVTRETEQFARMELGVQFYDGAIRYTTLDPQAGWYTHALARWESADETYALRFMDGEKGATPTIVIQNDRKITVAAIDYDTSSKAATKSSQERVLDALRQTYILHNTPAPKTGLVM